MMTTTTLLKNACVLFGLLLLSIQVRAATRTVTSTGNWTTASTWQSNLIPTSTDNVDMNNNKSVTIRNGETISVQAFSSGNGNTLIIEAGGSLTVTQISGGNNMTIIVRGTLTVNGTIDFASDNGLSITVDAGGSLMVTGDVSGSNMFAITANGSITIGGDLSGDMNSTITGGGTISVSGTVSGPAGFSGSSLLPVTLRYFKGSSQSGGVLLIWATEAEINNDFYTLEKSIDGIQFGTLAKVKGAGNSLVPLDYQYLDKTPFAKSYYRLSQTDYDGATTIFNTVEVTHRQSSEVKIFPTLIENQQFFISINENSRLTDLILVGQDGKAYFKTKVQAGVMPVELSEKLSPGVYFVQVFGEGESTQTIRIVIR